MKILVIDNFDSFTYNLVQYLGELGVALEVVRNDAITLDDIEKMQPDGIVISPGPGTPDDAGISLDVIKTFAGQIPIFGVCLGHQAISQAFGARIIQAPRLMHGKTSEIRHEGTSVFTGLENPFIATRYHSLVAEPGSIPTCLKITAKTDDGVIMAVEHDELPVVGVQFHPESILTEAGKQILQNFLDRYILERPKKQHEKPASKESSDLLHKMEFPKPAIEVSSMVQNAIQSVVENENLSRAEASEVMNAIMHGEATEAQKGALLVAMRMKGETPEEIAGFAHAMRVNALPVVSSQSAQAVDLVGTGGDGKHTFNISTLASFVVAGADVPVAKHGNRSVSSKCGSADVLMELGVNLELDNEQLGQCLDEVGIAFLFAPKLHVAMKHVVGARREIGVRSVFNILGPITNPAGVSRQLIGVYDPKLLRLLAEVLKQLDSKHVMFVHSNDGLDEISMAAETRVAELKHGEIHEYTISPEEFGLARNGDVISGGDAKENAVMALDILNGKDGAARDVVIANAAAGLYVAGKAHNLSDGAQLAAQSIDSGAAMQKLRALKKFTQAFQ